MVLHGTVEQFGKLDQLIKLTVFHQFDTSLLTDHRMGFIPVFKLLLFAAKYPCAEALVCSHQNLVKQATLCSGNAHKMRMIMNIIQ